MTNQPNVINIKQLASELFLLPKSLRKKIRDNKLTKPGTRWEWPENHETVSIIRSWKDQPAKSKKLEEVKEVEAPTVLEEKVSSPQTIFTKGTKSGKWEVLKGSEGIKAIYTAGRSYDETKWITQESEIRKTLPNYIKEIIKKAL